MRLKLSFIILILSLQPLVAQSIKTANELLQTATSQTKEKPPFWKFNKRKDHKPFILGSTGMIYSIKDKGTVFIEGALQGSKAEGLFESGDLLTHINNQDIQAQTDFRQLMGQCLAKAELNGGDITFTIQRKSVSKKISIKLAKKGAFSDTWPVNCNKSKKIVENAASHVIQQLNKENLYKNIYTMDRPIAGLFLLSTGEKQYLPNAKKIAHELTTSQSTSSWIIGYQGLFLCEYYIRTQDKTVLPRIRAIVSMLEQSSFYGLWGHGVKRGLAPGYMNGGSLNSASLPLLMTLLLAQECGIPVKQKVIKESIGHFFRLMGYGHIGYGNHRPTYYLGDNGKESMLSCVMELLESQRSDKRSNESPFVKAAEFLALNEADSYDMFEVGHGTTIFNILWRGIGTQNVSSQKHSNYRRQLDYFKWYLDLCSRESGAFHPYPFPSSWQMDYRHEFKKIKDHVYVIDESKSSDMGTTATMAMMFTAPLKNLRIMGAERTTPVPNVAIKEFLKSNKKSPLYYDQNFCEGVSDGGISPADLHLIFYEREKPYRQKIPLDFSVKMMRHYSPSIRLFAAVNLGFLGGDKAVEEILKALKSNDPRVQRAGLDAFSGKRFWGTSKVNIPDTVIREKLLPEVINMLQKNELDYFVKEAVIVNLHWAEQETILQHLELLLKISNEDNWWWHQSAVWGVIKDLDFSKLDKDLTKRLVVLLTKNTIKQHHLRSSDSSPRVFQKIIKESKLDDTLKKQIVKKLCQKLNNLELPKDTVGSIGQTYQGMTLKKLSVFEPTMIIEAGADEINKYLSSLSKWPAPTNGLGLLFDIKKTESIAYIISKSGKEAGAIMPGMKNAIKELEKIKKEVTGVPRNPEDWPRWPNFWKGKQGTDLINNAKQIIIDYEKEFGPVKTAKDTK